MNNNGSLVGRDWGLLFVAWLCALVSTLAALFIGEIMGQAPCILCWYQRIFMFPLAIILGIAVYLSDDSVRHYGVALAGGGWLVAMYHSLLYLGIIPEKIQPCTLTGPSCTGSDMTLFGTLPLPVVSLFAFTVIFVCLALPYRRKQK